MHLAYLCHVLSAPEAERLPIKAFARIVRDIAGYGVNFGEDPVITFGRTHKHASNAPKSTHGLVLDVGDVVSRSGLKTALDLPRHPDTWNQCVPTGRFLWQCAVEVLLYFVKIRAVNPGHKNYLWRKSQAGPGCPARWANFLGTHRAAASAILLVAAAYPGVLSAAPARTLGGQLWSPQKAAANQ